MNKPEFGGPWTERKLEALEKYLSAYLKIFTTNPGARNFTRHYVDVFAGIGQRLIRISTAPLFEEAAEAKEYMDGSVRKVLSLDKEFHKYRFIEKNSAYITSLEQMVKKDFPERYEQCKFVNADANEFLPEWADELKSMDRAVVFLDPYGMNVKWSTVEELAGTERVDLWMLVPSSAIIRLLKNGPLEEGWIHRLTEFFGSEDWMREFYPETTQRNLYEMYENEERNVNEGTVSNYLIRKLKEIFAGVIDNPLTLRNSRNSPLFMFMFAAGNPHGSQTAIKIAGDIIKST